MTRLVSVMLAVEEQNPQPFTGHGMGRLGQHTFAPGWFDCLLELKSRSKDTGLVDTLAMPICMHSGAHEDSGHLHRVQSCSVIARDIE